MQKIGRFRNSEILKTQLFSVLDQPVLVCGSLGASEQSLGASEQISTGLETITIFQKYSLTLRPALLFGTLTVYSNWTFEVFLSKVD